MTKSYNAWNLGHPEVSFESTECDLTFIHTEPGTTSNINKCQNAGTRKHVYYSEQVFGLIRNTTD